MPPNSGSLRVAVYGAESFFGGSKTSPSVKSWGPFFQKVPLAGFGAEPQGLALSAAIKSAFKKSERKVRAALTKAPPRQYVQRCGEEECENVIKEKLSVTSRCMPFEQEHIADTCVCCGKPAKKMVYWGRAY